LRNDFETLQDPTECIRVIGLECRECGGEGAGVLSELADGVGLRGELADGILLQSLVMASSSLIVKHQ
jgi:hypothetical protein